MQLEHARRDAREHQRRLTQGLGRPSPLKIMAIVSSASAWMCAGPKHGARFLTSFPITSRSSSRRNGATAPVRSVKLLIFEIGTHKLNPYQSPCGGSKRNGVRSCLQLFWRDLRGDKALWGALVRTAGLEPAQEFPPEGF
jgi:hypothetical protein